MKKVTCYNCGCVIEEKDEEFIDDNGNTWCESCWSEESERIGEFE